MNAITPTAPRVDLRGLIDAIAQANADDAMTNPLSPTQWEAIAPYLQPMVFPAGHTVFTLHLPMDMSAAADDIPADATVDGGPGA